MKSEDKEKTGRAIWTDLLERTRYRVDQVFAGGSFVQFLLLGVLTMLVIFFGMTAYFFGLFGEVNKGVEGIGRQLDQGFLDSFWWSMKHVILSDINSDYGATTPVIVISMLITLMGMILFGALIGFIGTAIDGHMDELKKGNGVVKEKGHLLILGWNDKIYSILGLLEDNQKSMKVVILSSFDIEQMQELLRTNGKPLHRIRPVLRTGSPTNIVELQRVAFESAFSIIVLADESGENQNEVPDIRVIKTLMLLAANKQWQGTRPKMVAEILAKDYSQVAEIAADNKILVLCGGGIISKVIVQTARQPGLSRVYSELFGFAGNEIYIRDFPACIGRSFGDIQACFINAIPIGVSRMRMVNDQAVYEPSTNPGKDYIIQTGEWIICIARDGHIQFDPSLQPRHSEVEVIVDATRPPLEKILILGWNEHLYDIVQEFDKYLKPGTPLLVVAAHTEEDASALFQEHIKSPLKNAQLTYKRLDYVKQGALNELQVEKIDCVVLLADDSNDESDPDSRTIMTLLLLRDLQRHLPEQQRKRIVAEIVHAANCELLQDERHLDLIISPQMVSMLLTQISQQIMLKSVYDDLLDAGGNEIYLKPISRYTNHPEKSVFSDIMAAAVEKKELAIGIKIMRENEDSQRNFGIYINPPRDHVFALEQGDKVIAVAEDLYDAT